MKKLLIATFLTGFLAGNALAIPMNISVENSSNSPAILKFKCDKDAYQTPNQLTINAKAHENLVIDIYPFVNSGGGKKGLNCFLQLSDPHNQNAPSTVFSISTLYSTPTVARNFRYTDIGASIGVTSFIDNTIETGYQKPYVEFDGVNRIIKEIAGRINIQISDRQVNPQIKTLGYYTNWDTYARNYQPYDVPASRITDGLYAFAQIGNCKVDPSQSDHCLSGSYNKGIQDWKLHSTDPWSDFAFIPNDYKLSGTSGLGNAHKFAYKMHKYKHNAILSIGGYTLSHAISEMLEDGSRIRVFVNSIEPFLKKLSFNGFDVNKNVYDGIDIDWEPNGNQWTFLNNPQKARKMLENYLYLFKEINQLIKEKKISSVSVAVPASPKIINKAEKVLPNFWQNLSQLVNSINVMSYDYHGGFDQPKVTNFNAPLKFDPNQPQTVVGRESFNIDSTVRTYLAKGVSSDKIILGIAAYGRSVIAEQGLDENHPGLYQNFEGIPQGEYGNDGVFDYRTITLDFPRNGFKLYDIPAAGASAAYNKKTYQWTSYNSLASIKNIVQTEVVNRNLQGAMIWSLSGDIRTSDAGHYSNKSITNYLSTVQKSAH